MGAISSNGMFTLDPRVASRCKLVNPTDTASQSKVFASKMKFTSAVTTSNGKVIAASEDGYIRIYNSLGASRAIAALPGMGCELNLCA